MSEEMAVSDNASGEEAKINGDEATETPAADAEDASAEPETESALPEPAEVAAEPEDPPPEPEAEPTPETELTEPEPEQEQVPEEQMDHTDGPEPERGIKRRASAAFSDDGDNFKGSGDDVQLDEEFKGFENEDEKNVSTDYSKVLERLEAEVTAAKSSFTPIKIVSAHVRALKRQRQDTDGSRPSSALSSRSDGEGALSNTEAGSWSSPAGRGRRATTEMWSPLLRAPLERGWRRELVYRAALDAHQRRNADIYYYTPAGKKLRSTREVAEHLSGTGLTLENFSFFKEPLGIDDPEKEIIRDAKLMRRVESPVSAPAPLEGKRTPKPKPPKGASPDHNTPKSPPLKIKVKSVGSRISATTTPTPKGPKKPAEKPADKPADKPAEKPAEKPSDNNNSAPWKRPSEDKRTRGSLRVANGVTSPEVSSPRRRGRPKLDETDYFTTFLMRAKELHYHVGTQIFQYLGMRDLAHCARVCRQWRDLADTPALWRHVRMKNSYVNSWAGLCAALRRHGTRRLDLRKMLLPHQDQLFWSQFAMHIHTVDTLERIELCRCPASAVEAVCALPSLRGLSALAIRDALMDPSPLAALPQLTELRLKSMAGLTLTCDLAPFAALTNLQHLSLTSIKDLGWCASDVIGQLEKLETLELGECTFRAEFGSVLRKLRALRRLRLERGTAQCAAPQLLRALATLPLLTRLELVNIDIKVGFDDALAECKNIQRLLIIPTYVSQSATTNKQVLSGVLRLKDTLTHLMWGVTIELLRVTELFIDQCEQSGDKQPRELGECIPVLKPVPGCRLLPDQPHVQGPPQVEILPLPMLQKLLSSQLPNTKLKLLRIPFHATWRQSLADFQ